MSEDRRPIRVMIVDDDLMVRETLSEYLLVADDIEITSVCADGLTAIEAARTSPPDVVLMDVRMPGLDGIAATRAVIEVVPGARVLALSTFDSDESIAAIFEAGGVGFLLKNTRALALVEAVRAAHAGLSVVPPDLVGRWNPGRSLPTPPRLLPRERQVLTLLAQGTTNTEIAKRLFVSASTVKLHVASLMRKLGAENRTSLAARAQVLGLIDDASETGS